MKKQSNGSIRSFLAGVLTTLLILSLSVPALAAATKTIDVFTGVSIYVDDVKLNPTDAAGNPVEPFIYNGTTYLPVRAVSEALGKSVQWDGSTYSVYIGKHSSGKPAIYLSEMDYFSGDETISTAAQDKDNFGRQYHNCIIGHGGSYARGTTERSFLLNGQYSALTGTFYQRYDYKSSLVTGAFYVYGDDSILYSCEFDKDSTGNEPIDFNVDLTGVLKLRIVFEYTEKAGEHSGYHPDGLALGDVALWP